MGNTLLRGLGNRLLRVLGFLYSGLLRWVSLFLGLGLSLGQEFYSLPFTTVPSLFRLVDVSIRRFYGRNDSSNVLVGLLVWKMNCSLVGSFSWGMVIEKLWVLVVV